MKGTKINPYKVNLDYYFMELEPHRLKQ